MLRTFSDDPGNEIRTYSDSPYITNDNIHQVFKNANNQTFSVLSLNIHSLNNKFDVLLLQLSKLTDQNLFFSVICLQETWLSEDHDVSIFNIPGYNLVHSGKSSSECGVLITYVHDVFLHSVKHVINKSKIWEGFL